MRDPLGTPLGRSLSFEREPDPLFSKLENTVRMSRENPGRPIVVDSMGELGNELNKAEKPKSFEDQFDEDRTPAKAFTTPIERYLDAKGPKAVRSEGKSKGKRKAERDARKKNRKK